MRILLWFALLAPLCSAQTIEVENLFQPAPLSGMWKHQAGDDPRWADPAFDDTAWQSVRMPEEARNPDLGFSWYRFRVRLPENMPNQPLALMVGGFGASQAYEVFWNGQRAGAMGDPIGGMWGQRISVAKVIPVMGHKRDVVVAIRLRAASTRYAFTSRQTSWIGTEDGVRDRVELWRGERLRSAQPLLLIAASLLLSAVLFLLLPIWRRDAPEYFWFGFWLLSATVLRVVSGNPDVVGLEGSLAAGWIVTLSGIGLISGWLGWMRTLFLGRITATVWLASAVAVALLLGITAVIAAGGIVTPLVLFWLNILANSYYVFVYYQLGWKTSREMDRMPAVHIAILTYFAVNFLTYGTAFFVPTSVVGIQGPLVRTVTGLLFTFVITILMNQRSARLLGERQRLSGELASAAEVQSLLLASLPTAGDFCQIKPVYLPASEVGGDFYQVLERPGGARVVLVGDVSGKGLKAAMLVSVAIGILRNEKSASPGAILTALNNGLSGQTGGGFVTCCCACFDPDGTVTIANAGHPSPYCDGREVEVEAGLPLGVVRGIEYAETVVRGKQFTFVSDGVVESENDQRELFGFDRTREISGGSAQEIADAAKAWGQNDDITVVTVRRNS